jgi:hypothetical protein
MEPIVEMGDVGLTTEWAPEPVPDHGIHGMLMDVLSVIFDRVGIASTSSIGEFELTP